MAQVDAAGKDIGMSRMGMPGMGTLGMRMPGMGMPGLQFDSRYGLTVLVGIFPPQVGCQHPRQPGEKHDPVARRRQGAFVLRI
jgi:hypothetical protein